VRAEHRRGAATVVLTGDRDDLTAPLADRPEVSVRRV